MSIWLQRVSIWLQRVSIWLQRVSIWLQRVISVFLLKLEYFSSLFCRLYEAKAKAKAKAKTKTKTKTNFFPFFPSQSSLSRRRGDDLDALHLFSAANLGGLALGDRPPLTVPGLNGSSALRDAVVIGVLFFLSADAEDAAKRTTNNGHQQEPQPQCDAPVGSTRRPDPRPTRSWPSHRHPASITTPHHRRCFPHR